MKCPNCGRQLSCGCQKKKSNKGTACCAQCVNALNAKEAAQNVQPVKK